MKKFSLFVALFAAFLFANEANAAATKAERVSKAATTAAITDGSNGNTADVSNNGDMVVRGRPKTVETSYSSAGTTATVIASDPITVYSISYTGGTAGDQCDVYDAESGTASGGAKFEIEIGTAKSTTTLDFGNAGIAFSNGLVIRTVNTAGGFFSAVVDTDTIS